jgi:hypothetical protein
VAVSLSAYAREKIHLPNLSMTGVEREQPAAADNLVSLVDEHPEHSAAVVIVGDDVVEIRIEGVGLEHKPMLTQHAAYYRLNDGLVSGDRVPQREARG